MEWGKSVSGSISWPQKTFQYGKSSISIGSLIMEMLVNTSILSKVFESCTSISSHTSSLQQQFSVHWQWKSKLQQLLVLLYFAVSSTKEIIFLSLTLRVKKYGNISFLAAHFIYMPGQAKYFQVRAKLEPSLGSDLSLGIKTKAVLLKAHCKLNE